MAFKTFEDMADPALAGFVDAGTVGVLPVAAIEPHGPHLPLTTDRDIARGHLAALQDYLAAELSVAVLPLQEIGWSVEHAAFPGLESREPEQLLAEWGELARAFHSAGGRRLVIVSSHGGNSPVVDILIRRLRVELGLLAVGTAWLRFGQPQGLFGDDELKYGVHGGAVETSLMLHYAPGSVVREACRNFGSALPDIEGDFAALSAFGPHRFGWMSQDLNPAGVVGDATAASAGKGAASARQALEGFAQLLADVAAFDLGALRPGEPG